MRVVHPPLLSAALVRAPEGVAGAFHTVELMRELVENAKVNPSILWVSHSIVGMIAQHSPEDEVRALYEFVRDDVRYTGDVLNVETLTDPVYILQRMTGDCDDKSTLLAALLESIGYPTRFVLAGYTLNSKQYEHVYLQALIPDDAGGHWVSLDPAVSSSRLGWEAPGATAYWIESIDI